MPLKLNVSLARKIGQENYGSLAAHCGVELELEGSLLQHDPAAFQRHVSNAYAACEQAVQAELAQQQQGETSATSNGQALGGNGHQNGNGHHGNGQAESARSCARRATASQVRAIHAIAERLSLDLVPQLRSRYGIERPEELSIAEASELIDAIKVQPNGAGGRR